MSFDLKLVKNYGDARLGDVEISDGTAEDFESYARVTGIDELDDYKIILDLDNAFVGRFGTFKAGEEILLHVSASTGETEFLGKYLVAKILLVSTNNIITLDKKITELIPRDQFNFYNVQAVLSLQFDCLTLKNDGEISPKPFDQYNFYGGILFLKCWDSLKFEGGHINLKDLGIPSNRKHLLRPLTEQETAANGESDVAKYSGQENFITAERFLLNAGDGACFIVAKNLYGNTESRIGNPETHGAHFCRGAYNSVGVKPANITNVGGSTILICAENIYNFDEKMIAKYRSASEIESEQGRGLCRCYIASNTILRNDEGLYAYDILSDRNSLSRKLNVKDFGTGNYGSVNNFNKVLNNYAQVTAINQGGCRLTLANETTNGLTPLAVGEMILVQVIQRSQNATLNAGEVIITKIMQRGENYIVTDYPAPDVDLEDYQLQIISIPQFENFTLNEEYTATPKFNGKIGGVFAIAVKNHCDLREGKINVEGKGGATAYGANGLAYIGNAQDSFKLPVGSGNGSVFILAKTLTLNENTRIGALYSGLGTNNRLGGSNAALNNVGGGYSGASDKEGAGSAGGYIGGGGATQNIIGGVGGSGANGGTSRNYAEFTRSAVVGGYGSNGLGYGKYKGGNSGAHLLIIADKINNFNQACFSTGGEGSKGAYNGAAGYGGGAGLSSGGSSGFCFIYSN